MIELNMTKSNLWGCVANASICMASHLLLMGIPSMNELLVEGMLQNMSESFILLCLVMDSRWSSYRAAVPNLSKHSIVSMAFFHCIF